MSGFPSQPSLADDTGFPAETDLAHFEGKRAGAKRRDHCGLDEDPGLPTVPGRISVVLREPRRVEVQRDRT